MNILHLKSIFDTPRVIKIVIIKKCVMWNVYFLMKILLISVEVPIYFRWNWDFPKNLFNKTKEVTLNILKTKKITEHTWVRSFFSWTLDNLQLMKVTMLTIPLLLNGSHVQQLWRKSESWSCIINMEEKAHNCFIFTTKMFRYLGLSFR